MYGKLSRLEKKLREIGKTAPATIVEAKKGRFALSSGGDAAQEVASAHINWKLKLSVTPDGEPAFDAEVKEGYGEMGLGPAIGSTVNVLYDPNDHSKVVIAHHTQEEVLEQLQGLQGGLAQMREQMHASAQHRAAQARLEQLSGESAEQRRQEAVADPAGFAQRMFARADEVKSAGGAGGAPVAGMPGFAAAPDPADEIAKLADLRDRGALSDEEFQAQKKKILGT